VPTSPRAEEVSWQVMADPVGIEFCILAPYPPDVRELWQAQYDAHQRP